MTRWRLIGSIAGILVVVALVSPFAAYADPPTIERIDIDESFLDEFLTEACGVPVTTTAEGFIIIRTFSGEGSGVVELTTLNIRLTATAGDSTYSFRDVGADLTRIEPDGTAVLSIIGQVPFGFTGILKIDLGTGEAILEPQHSTEENIEVACAVLTG